MLSAIAAFLQAQPIFTGLVGAAFAGGVMFVCRQLPTKAMELLRDTFTVTLVVEQRDEAFGFLAGWLAEHHAVKRARRLMLTEAYNHADRRWNTVVTLGRGWHLLRYAGAWLLVNREVKDAEGIAAAIGAGNNQRFWLMSIGRRQDAVRALIADARAHYYGGGLVNVHFWHDGAWLCADRRPPRPLESVFMPPAQKAGILADVRQFLAARALYGARGVPWRRGYLLKGPPGTGKTTLIFAVASALVRPIYSLNLSNVKTDNELLAAFNQAESDAIVVIEDIDTAAITRDRETVQANANPVTDALSGDNVRRVTLSGLLNAIDGLAARDGRILFITSNHAEQLDAALTRPGRIDRTEEICRLGRDEALAMIQAFEADPAMVADLTLPIAAAELQGLLLSRRPHLRLVDAA